MIQGKLKGNYELMALGLNSFLMLTTNVANDQRKLNYFSRAKQSLALDRTKAMREYESTLSAICYKWTTNAGASYVDLSYKNLMKPSAANGYKPYLITNASGKVIVDTNYKKYAEMISPDGSKGDWSAVRTQVLASVTGISADKIDNASATADAVTVVANEINALKEEGDKLKASEPVSADTAAAFFAHAGSVNVGGTDFDVKKLYNTNSWQNLGSSGTAALSSLKGLLSGISDKMASHLLPEDATAFQKACDTFLKANDHYFTGNSDADKQGLEAGTIGIKKEGDNFQINLTTILNQILSSYKNNAPKASGQDSTGTDKFYTRDLNSSAWKDWKVKYDDWESRYNDALSRHKAAVNTDNMSLTAEEEKNIQFYDKIFSAIAANGWVADERVEDDNYLNLMLQNNQYFITTIGEETDDDGKTNYRYDSTIASNCEHIVSVNNKRLQDEALTKYEREKTIISNKEARIDEQMQNIQARMQAREKMKEGSKTMTNDNIKRAMNVFA